MQFGEYQKSTMQIFYVSVLGCVFCFSQFDDVLIISQFIERTRIFVLTVFFSFYTYALSRCTKCTISDNRCIIVYA